MQLSPPPPRRRRLGAFALLAALGAGACASARPRAPTQVGPEEVFRYDLTLLDGRHVDERAMRGQVVLLDVWATWCAPCEKSFPFYAELERRYRDEGLVVVAVSVDERAEDVRAWLEGRDLPFVFAHDPEGALPERIGLKTMPSALVLDRESHVRGAHAGFRPGDEAEVERMVRDALGLAAP